MALRSYRQCMSASGTKPTWRIDPLMSAFKAKQTVALCSTQSSKRTSRNLRRVRIRDIQLSAAKVSNPKFRGKKRKFPRHFKGHFSIGNMQVRILPGQPGSHSTGDSPAINPESARQMRLFAIVSSVSILQNSTIYERNRRKSLANT